MMRCKTCGNEMIGDGYKTVVHCENVDIFEACAEPDANALHCKSSEPESTEDHRVWHSGPPPYVGWWNASRMKDENNWRWWNGANWSNAVSDLREAEYAAYWAKSDACKMFGDVEWNDYWPASARVPRLAPEDFEIGARWTCVDPVWPWEFRGLEYTVVNVTDRVLALDSYRSRVVEPLAQLPSAHHVPSRCVGPQTRWDFPMPKEPAVTGVATVWHEGSKSFYRATLHERLTAADVAAEGVCHG